MKKGIRFSKRAMLIFCELIVCAAVLSGCGSAKAKNFSESFTLNGRSSPSFTLNATTESSDFSFSDVNGSNRWMFKVNGDGTDILCAVISADESESYRALFCMDPSYNTFTTDSGAEGFGFLREDGYYHVISIDDECSLIMAAKDQDTLFDVTSAIDVSVSH